MNDVRDIAINLIAAAIGALAAWSVAHLRQWRKQRRIRRFWSGMANRGITVVVGAQDRDAVGAWEPSGLVGLGDVTGLITLQRELQRIGCPVRVSTADSLAPNDRQRDLVLLGGPDANELTAAIMERYESVLTVAIPGWRTHNVAIRDRATGLSFVSRYGVDRAVSVDYGLAIRVPNPLASGRKTEILILAGCWGYGTAGASEAVCDSDFLQLPVIRAHRYFEAVVETAVHGNAAHYVEPKLVREIQIHD